MLDLTRWFGADLLTSTYDYERSATMLPSDDGRLTFVRRVPARQAHLSDGDIALQEIMGVSLSRFQRHGPAVIRPSYALCEKLMATEVRLNVRDYSQPHEVVGVEIPPEIAGEHHPCLMLVWRPNRNSIYLWSASRADGIPEHTDFMAISTQWPTIEDSLEPNVGGLPEADSRYLHDISRIALNACLTAMHRPERTVTEPLPEHVTSRRRRNDRRINILAGRHVQEISFRDLVLPRRSSRPYVPGASYGPQLPQRRRAHWNLQVHGKRRALRKLILVDEYWTHREDLPPSRAPAIIYR